VANHGRVIGAGERLKLNGKSFVIAKRLV